MMSTQYFILKHLSHINILFGSPGVGRASTRNFLTFVKTTAIVGHQNPEALVDFLPVPVCNSSRVYKRQKIAGRKGFCILGHLVAMMEPFELVKRSCGAILPNWCWGLLGV